MEDPELRLVIAACRAAYMGGGLAVQDWKAVRWDRMLSTADRHRVQAICWHGMGEAQALAPAEIAEQYTARSRAIVEANLRAVVECSRLRKDFRAADIELLFLKGLTLGALAYPDPMLKMGWDIDLLVAPSRIGGAAQLLRDAGYALLIPSQFTQMERWHASRKESVWQKSDGSFTIDLHSRLADHPAMLPDLGMQSPRQVVTIAKGIDLPTLAKDELFAYLCVHGASSAWFRLKWIVDLAALLHRESADEIVRLYGRSQQLGAGRAADQALLLASHLFGLALPPDLHRQLEGSRVSRWLAGVAQSELSCPREPTERFLGTAAIHYSQPFLLPGLGFTLSELARQTRGALAA